MSLLGSEFDTNMKVWIPHALCQLFQLNLLEIPQFTRVMLLTTSSMTTVYPSSGSCFQQQDNVLCHKAQIISKWFKWPFKWPQQTPDLIPINHSWDMVKQDICNTDAQLTNLQQPCNAINMSI